MASKGSKVIRSSRVTKVIDQLEVVIDAMGIHKTTDPESETHIDGQITGIRFAIRKLKEELEL